MDDEDFIRGNPEHVVLGRPDEKPAKKHSRQKPKPITLVTIRESIRARMEFLKPIRDEFEALERAIRALEE